MRYLLIISFVLFTIKISSAQRQEFQPTIDIGLNGGVSFGSFPNNALKNRGWLKVGGLNLMANTGFNRHVLEFDLANNLNDKGLNEIWGGVHYYTLLPSTLNLNYTFAREVFAYYPACMIRNQILLGLRLNAEVFMGNEFFRSDYSPPVYTVQDYGRYSADITLITDFHIDKSNYLMLQLYTPILTYFVRPVSLGRNIDEHFELADRLDISKGYFFNEGEFGWMNLHSKIGVNATYRLLLKENIALQLKYNGKINSTSAIDMDYNLPILSEIKENYHQLTLGIVGHITRPPIGF